MIASQHTCSSYAGSKTLEVQIVAKTLYMSATGSSCRVQQPQLQW
jgi:hypothetical protein